MTKNLLFIYIDRIEYKIHTVCRSVSNVHYLIYTFVTYTCNTLPIL